VGVRRYDFLGGEDPSKDRWGAKVGNYVDIHFARPYTRGSVYLGFDQAARSAKVWLRSNLPTPALGALRRASHIVRGQGMLPDERKPEVSAKEDSSE
jgi:hypothetical protein